MKYGTLVAFVHAGAIAFGVLMERITRENAAGETTEYVIEMGDEAKTRVTVTNEDDLAAIRPEYPSLVSQDVGVLHKRSATFELAKERADQIAHPTRPADILRTDAEVQAMRDQVASLSQAEAPASSAPSDDQPL